MELGAIGYVIKPATRERLFDLVMRRLDALAPYKAGLRRIAPVIRRDPLTMAALNRGAVNSWRYMLASAGIANDAGDYYFRLSGHRFDGEAGLALRARSRPLQDGLQRVWERSRECSELRAIGL